MTVPFVQLIEVDVVGAKPPQTVLSSLNDVVPRRSRVVRAIAHGIAHLSRDEHLIPIGAERLAEYLFGQAAGIHVCCVEEVDAGVARQPYLLTRPLHVDLADGAGPPPATKAHGAEGDRRNTQAATAELSILHAAESRATLWIDGLLGWNLALASYR